MKSEEKKAVYRVRNWADYNAGLIRRGDISLWFNPDLVERWKLGESTGKSGRPFVHSDQAIETMLVLRCLYRLPLRATEGLMRSLLSLLEVDVGVPSYSTFCRRQSRLPIQQELFHSPEPIHLLIDSTGVKVFGEGEWKVRQHGPGKRRLWRKLHLAVDANTRQILATSLTESAVADAEVFPKLLLAIDGELEKVSADGAYDTWECRLRAHLHSPDVSVVIPPRENAVESAHSDAPYVAERNAAVQTAEQNGSAKWKQDSGYHTRSVVETFMFRFKKSFGPELLAREIKKQAAEALTKTNILNQFMQLARPVSVKIEK